MRHTALAIAHGQDEALEGALGRGGIVDDGEGIDCMTAPRSHPGQYRCDGAGNRSGRAGRQSDPTALPLAVPSSAEVPLLISAFLSPLIEGSEYRKGRNHDRNKTLDMDGLCGRAGAGGDPGVGAQRRDADTCEAAKNKVAGKYAFCSPGGQSPPQVSACVRLHASP